MASRKPDYRVGALNKRTNSKNILGGAWKNEDGTISVVLDDFVVLSQHSKELLITLFPAGRDVPA